MIQTARTNLQLTFFLSATRAFVYIIIMRRKKKKKKRRKPVPPSIHKTRLIPRNWTTPFHATPLGSLGSLGRSFAYFQPGYSKSRGVDVITSGHKRPAPLRLLFNCAQAGKPAGTLLLLLLFVSSSRRRERTKGGRAGGGLNGAALVQTRIDFTTNKHASLYASLPGRGRGRAIAER